MNQFKEKLLNHAEHIKNVGKHCTTEETTKQALILPLLDILGFSPYDPTKVKAEYKADFTGVKASERVDYALFCQGIPVIFIEAKSWSENLSNHCPQLSRYFNATPEVSLAAITNGKEWRFFMDLEQKNVMDEKPFLKIQFDNLQDTDVAQLSNFRHDHFQSEALRTIAEESIYLSLFTKIISNSLKEIPEDFVRFVASQSKISRQLNKKFIESITPIVKQAIEKSVSGMVVSGLSSNIIIENDNREETTDPTAPIINPDNEKIITTYKEQQLYQYVKTITEDEEVTFKDTESYLTILYQNKINRSMLRYFEKKQNSTIQLPLELTSSQEKEILRAGLSITTGNQIIIEHPENILRIAGIILDVYHYVKNDENFRRKTINEIEPLAT